MGRLLDMFIRTFACSDVDLPCEDVGMMRAAGEARVGDWMETWQGVRFYPLDPRPEEVLLADIAHHLARINRYNGACEVEHYSVAEHSVLMAEWMLDEYEDPLLAYQALFHDAPEAYIGDMVRPLKRNMPSFVEAEGPVYEAVVKAMPMLWAAHDRHGVGYDLDKRVKAADNRILVDERRQVMRPSGNPWGIDHMEPLGVRIEGWAPSYAEHFFLAKERSLREMWQAA